MKITTLKWSGFALISGIMLSSCLAEIEGPIVNELAIAKDQSTAINPGGENFRKGPNGVFYQEKFSNQSIVVENPAAFPGFGQGQATYIGKGYSFFNQYALGFPNEEGIVFTEAAPVTEYFGNQLIALGININELDSNPKIVSSLTTDGKGNTIWFNNITNEAKFDLAGNIAFTAEIEIVGGTGKFKGASGTGTVVGNVNGSNGKGSTTVRASILF